MGSLADLFTLKDVCFYKLRTKTVFQDIIFKITYVALFTSVGENQCALMVRKIQLANISRRIPVGFSSLIQRLIFSFDCILYPFNCASFSEFLPSFDRGISIIIICFSWRWCHLDTISNFSSQLVPEEKLGWSVKGRLIGHQWRTGVTPSWMLPKSAPENSYISQGGALISC